jgi:male-specific lethal 1
LTFNEKIKNDLLLDKEFIDLLKTLKINDEKSQEALLKSVCQQIEWNLKEKRCEQKPETSAGHIMISYNFASRAMCLEIKKRLESYGYKIWIDVEEIHGSSLDAMAKAVENSFCVLMCVTEKYRQSVNCQAEAQYAFRINKKIIPLIMQSGYETVQGWLGIIMGDKIYINFEEFEFDVCIEKIIHELKVSESNMGKSNSVISMNDIKPQLSKTSSNKLEKWSEENVKDWFVANGLSLKIFEAFSPMNGDLLFQIYEMKNSAPEFYHQALIRIDNDMRSIMMFSMMITKLYSN